MAYIDHNGLLWSEPGDRMQVVHLIRPNDYGPLITPDQLPDILVWHLTGNPLPFGANTADKDGTRGMAGRIASGAAKYYAHLYVSRDGTVFQVCPMTRSAIHVAGSWQGREINRISNGIEMTNLGWTHLNGKGPGFMLDPTREDMRQDGGLLWQMMTVPQNTVVLELAEVWHRWRPARPIDDCLRGHHDVDPDSTHTDPGPDFRPFLLGPARAHLEAMAGAPA